MFSAGMIISGQVGQMLIINPIDSKLHVHAFTVTTTEVDKNPESLTSQHGLDN